jgi:activator of 2-hydroxyglutaryl-CoA dehydratase
MLTMGIDIGSRSSKCVIMEDAKLLTYGSIETGPIIVKTAQAVVDAAVNRRTSLWGAYRMPLPDVKVDHISGGIGRNVALVKKIEERLDGLQVNLPQEPMIVGAVGAALFALDRARKQPH